MQWKSEWNHKVHEVTVRRGAAATSRTAPVSGTLTASRCHHLEEDDLTSPAFLAFLRWTSCSSSCTRLMTFSIFTDTSAGKAGVARVVAGTRCWTPPCWLPMCSIQDLELCTTILGHLGQAKNTLRCSRRT